MNAKSVTTKFYFKEPKMTVNKNPSSLGQRYTWPPLNFSIHFPHSSLTKLQIKWTQTDLQMFKMPRPVKLYRRWPGSQSVLLHRGRSQHPWLRHVASSLRCPQHGEMYVKNSFNKIEYILDFSRCCCNMSDVGPGVFCLWSIRPLLSLMAAAAAAAAAAVSWLVMVSS